MGFIKCLCVCVCATCISKLLKRGGNLYDGIIYRGSSPHPRPSVSVGRASAAHTLLECIANMFFIRDTLNLTMQYLTV